MEDESMLSRSRLFRTYLSAEQEDVFTPNTGAFFQFMRSFGYNTYYAETPNPVTVDVLITGFILSAVIVAVCFYSILIGVKGWERLFVFIRVTISLFIGTSIMVCNYGQAWDVSFIETETAYKPTSPTEVHAHIGVQLGLRSVNITLTAGEKENHYRVQIQNHPNDEFGNVTETINYNERFYYGPQGRLGFGTQASEFNQEFRAAQFRGVPLPILWIAEYFTFDGEGIRWGRHFRQAGWYTQIMMWLAFPLWIISNILLFMVLQYGAFFMMLTGGVMILGNILWAGIRNFNPLLIPFSDDVLRFQFGWCWYLTLFTGIFCVVSGLIVLYMNWRYAKALCTFFGIDVRHDIEEYYPDPKEEKNTRRPTSTPPSQAELQTPRSIEEGAANASSNGGLTVQDPLDYQPRFRKMTFGKTLHKNVKKAPRAMPRKDRPAAPPPPEPDNDIYENIGGQETGNDQFPAVQVNGIPMEELTHGQEA